MGPIGKTIGVLGLVGSVAAYVGGGGQSETGRALAYRASLAEAIGKFEDARRKTVEVISGTTEHAVQALEKEKPDLPGSSETWQTEWKSAHQAFRELEEDFAAVAKSSKEFFRQLVELTDGIQDAAVKRAEDQKNRRLWESWNAAFTEAAGHLDKLRRILADGDDFSKVLLAAAIRESLEVNIGELKRISRRAEEMLGRLERLTQEGRRLVGRG